MESPLGGTEDGRLEQLVFDSVLRGVVMGFGLVPTVILTPWIYRLIMGANYFEPSFKFVWQWRWLGYVHMGFVVATVLVEAVRGRRRSVVGLLLVLGLQATLVFGVCGGMG